MNFHPTYKIELLLIALLVLFAFVFIFSGFLERPTPWFDEGITIEIARNFMLFGELDILTAPGMFSEVPYLVGTNGFPLTLPLALFFQSFGVGLLQARVFMLLWFMATVALLYLVTRKLFGPFSALATLALTVSFASFYGNGLTATGEMPGLLFFIVGIWSLVYKKDYFLTGISWGLAMAAKPGVFLLLAHTTVLFILIADRENWFKKLCRAGCGFIIPISIWILLAFPLTMGTFYSVITYVLNPIDIPAVSALLKSFPQEISQNDLIVPNTESAAKNTVGNLKLFITHSTLIYFSTLGFLSLLGLYWGRTGEYERKMFFLVLIYGLLTLFFFLRGPGWFRYLMGLQILIFIVLFPAVKKLVSRVVAYFSTHPLFKVVGIPYLTTAFIGSLFLMQVFQLYFFSNIPDSKGISTVYAYLEKRAETKSDITIGIYNVPEVAAFTSPNYTYHMSLPQHGRPPLGESPLLMEIPPDIIVINNKYALVEELEKEVLNTRYRQVESIQKLPVYEKTF